MCILFWYQNDGTDDKLVVSGPADAKSRPEKAAPAAPLPNTLDPHSMHPDFLDPNSEAGLEAASDYSGDTFDDPENPANKLLHRYKLILAANRDEYSDRGSRPLHFWNDAACDIVAGKDVKEGGTWLGLSRKFKCASAVLNKYVNNKEPNQLSRGSIVVNNLRNHTDFAERLKADCAALKYAPFYLLSFHFDGPLRVSYFTCGSDGQLKEKEITGTGFCSHTNCSMEDTKWEKAATGQELFQNVVTKSLLRTEKSTRLKVIRDLKSELLTLLKNQTRHPEDMAVKNTYEGILPAESTENTDLFSSICVKSKCEKFKYGTKVHTILIVDQKNEVYFIEQDAITGKEEYYRFNCH